MERCNVYGDEGHRRGRINMWERLCGLAFDENGPSVIEVGPMGALLALATVPAFAILSGAVANVLAVR